MSGRILILENSQPTVDAIRQILADGGHDTTAADDVATALKELGAGRADLLVANASLGGAGASDFLDAVRTAAPETPVILLIQSASECLAAEASQRGAYGYVKTPLDADHLRLLVLRALEYGQLLRENKRLRGDGGALAGRPLAEIEKQVILSTLERFKGHRLRTATALGIGLRTLGMKLKRWKEEGELIETRG